MPLAAAAFLQVNREAAGLLEEHLLTLAGSVAGQRVVDAFCGVGLYARRLARAGAEVIGIELDPDAVAAARAANASGAEFREGTVEALLPAALPAYLVILNPPRGGVAPEVVDALLPETDIGKRMDALDWNRRLWSTLATDCADSKNGLPGPLRASMISHSRRRWIVCPPDSPKTATLSSSSGSTSARLALPCLILISSARFSEVRRPMATSFVTLMPPTGSTALW